MIKKIIEFFEENKKVSFIFISLILIAMWYFSSLPGTSFGPAVFNWMPVAYHILIFFAFAFFFLAFITKKKIGIKEVLVTFLVSLMIGILDELHQSFVPFRSTTIQDVVIDMIGASSLIISYFLIRNHTPTLKASSFLRGRR